MSEKKLEELTNIINNAQGNISTAQKNIEHAQEQIKAMKEAEKVVWLADDINYDTRVFQEGNPNAWEILLSNGVDGKQRNFFNILTNGGYIELEHGLTSEKMAEYLNSNKFTKHNQ